MKFSTRPEADVSINLTPLIDVVFLLLIFFMVSATFSKESQLRIRLPEASITDQLSIAERTLMIQIDSTGEYAVQGPKDDKVRSLVNRASDTLQRALTIAMNGEDNLILVIRADRATTHESVIHVLDVARQVGLRDITFSIQQEESD